MSADNYGLFIDGKCVNIVSFDTTTSDINAYADAFGGIMVRIADFADGAWGIGATFDGSEVTPAPRPDLPPVDPNAPVPPTSSTDERFEALQRQIDDLTTMVLEG